MYSLYLLLFELCCSGICRASNFRAFCKTLFCLRQLGLRTKGGLSSLVGMFSIFRSCDPSLDELTLIEDLKMWINQYAGFMRDNSRHLDFLSQGFVFHSEKIAYHEVQTWLMQWQDTSSVCLGNLHKKSCLKHDKITIFVTYSDSCWVQSFKVSVNTEESCWVFRKWRSKGEGGCPYI